MKKIKLVCGILIISCTLSGYLNARTIFSPNNDGINDVAVFRMKIGTPDENINKWHFEIKDFKGKLIRQFEGDGPPPEKLKWDGKNKNKYLVSDGRYNYFFSIVTKAGNKVELAPQEIIVDRSNPEVSISVDLSIFSPNGDGVKDETVFSMQGSDASGINSWLLAIENKENASVRSFSEVGDVKARLIWDGKGDFGEDVPDGTYVYYLVIQDNAGNRVKTKPQEVRINREARVSAIKADLRVFSPNGDGVKDVITLEINVADITSIESWKLNILNSLGKVRKSFQGKGAPPHGIKWFGKDDKDKVVNDGVYRLILSETDKAGNTVSTVPVLVEVDNSPPVCRVGVDNKLISPNGDNILEQAAFSLKITDGHYLEWKLTVMDDVGKSVRIFTGKGKNPEKKLLWDGKDDNKKDVIDGNYKYVLEAKDIAENKFILPEELIQIDRTPPVIVAEASPTLFSPNGDGVMDETNFVLQIQDASLLKSWQLNIKNSAGKTVKVFKGKSSVEKNIIWGGKGDEKGVLPDGTYLWTVNAVDIAGNSSKIAPLKFVIGATKPTISVKSSLDVFSPNSDGIKDSVKFNVTVKAFNKIKDWSMKIVSTKSEVKHTFSGNGAPPAVITWYGEKDDKKPLMDGNYGYILEITDEAGNLVSSTRKPIIIDTAKPQITVDAGLNIFSPNGDSFKDNVSFLFKYKDDSSAAEWVLSIENEKRRTLKKFSGKGALPVSVIWDGKDDGGDVLRDGSYNYVLSAEDIVGNRVSTFKQTIKVDNTAPVVEISADPDLFSPNADGEKDVTIFSLDYRDASDISNWIVKATGAEHALATFKGTGRPSQNITWDGNNDRGSALPDGIYNVVLNIRDEVGNESKSKPIQVKIDTAKPVVAVETEESPLQALAPRRAYSETERGVVISLAAEVLFNVGEGNLKHGARDALTKVQNIIKRYPHRKISIEGHTDNMPINTAEFPNNYVLSEARAKSVLKYFVDKLKFAADRFTIKGRGDKQPVAPNTTEEGRKRNRRVEIILLK
jgi:flagellar motor protein MotB